MTDGEIRKTVTIDASPDVVFRALTDEKELVQWMPQEAKMDARVGGTYELKFHAAERGFDSVIYGDILELVPGKKISYTYTWVSVMPNGQPARPDYRPGDEPAVISWTLEELPDGKTLVTLVQTGLDPKFWPGAEAGWSHWIDQLVSHVNRTPRAKLRRD